LERHGQTVVGKTSRIRGRHQYSKDAQRLPISGELRSKRELGPRRGRRSQLNFQLAEYHGMIGEGYPVLRGRRSS